MNDTQLEALKLSVLNIFTAYTRYDQNMDILEPELIQITVALLILTKSDEVSIFWILVSLIENYELR